MGLINAIKENKSLRFIEAGKEPHYSVDSILFDCHPFNSLPHSLFFLYSDNTLKSIAIYFSFLGTHHTIALLNKNLDISLKEDLESDYQPKFIFDESRGNIKGHEVVKVRSENLEANLFVAPSKSIALSPNIKLLLSTSGTTGSPKFVKLSEENLIQNALSICDYLPIESKDITPLNLPIYYSYGLSVLNSNSLKGGLIVCGLPDILQKPFWKHFGHYGFSSLAGVPFTYEMLDRIGFLKKLYPSLKYLTQAGGNLDKNTKLKFLEYAEANQLKYYIMYGQTEATARISYVPPHRLKDKITSIGKPIKNGTLFIDPNNHELIYKGPNVFGGYAERKADLQHWEKNETLRTGDIAEMDNEGFFYIVGRLKRFVKLFGNRINLDEIERFVKVQYQEGLLACTGVKDEIILISYTDTNLDTSQIKQSIFERFKLHPSTIKLQNLPELPLTGNGKVDYKKITADYLQEIK